ncbi:MAG: ParB N-terminal domain-containing protein [Gemmataceae bacterium]
MPTNPNPQNRIPIARTGSPRPGVQITEVSLADLNPLHSVPRPGTPPNHIQNLAGAIQTNGYDLAQPIPVARMPDGRLVMMGGHHRAAARSQLQETTIPARVVDWDSISPGAQNLYRQLFPDFPWSQFGV